MYKKGMSVEELQNRLEQSERDKQQLKKSIEQLNECYSSKISILQNTIEAYENRIEELLELRKSEIDKQLSFASRYEQQNKKLVGIIENLSSTFDKEKAEFLEKLKQSDQDLIKIAEERDNLLSKSQDNQQRIDQLVKEHTKQIQQLKRQLMLLKEEVIEPSNGQSRQKQQSVDGEQMSTEKEIEIEWNQGSKNQNALRQITNLNQTSTQNQQTRIKQISKAHALQISQSPPTEAN